MRRHLVTSGDSSERATSVSGFFAAVNQEPRQWLSGTGATRRQARKNAPVPVPPAIDDVLGARAAGLIRRRPNT